MMIYFPYHIFCLLLQLSKVQSQNNYMDDVILLQQKIYPLTDPQNSHE
jgi:hypothetical protein